jgi:hypothetical protein
MYIEVRIDNVSRGVLAGMAYWRYVPLQVHLYVKVLIIAKIKTLITSLINLLKVSPLIYRNYI